MKKVMMLAGAGQIGMVIARRRGTGMKVMLRIISLWFLLGKVF